MMSPILFYAACAIGALGVALAMPRRAVSPYLIGAIVGAAALGLVLIGLAVAKPEALPNFHFYIFSALALGAALRCITHARPIYSALYFVLTILASTGLYLILAAEFMAFALIIVYAGAILITYLFVIMLASEGPTEEVAEAMGEYDRVAREPWTASVAGFVLIAALSTMFASGSGTLKLNPDLAVADRHLDVMPKRVTASLTEAKLLPAGWGLALNSTTGKYDINPRPDGQGALTIASDAGRGAERTTIAQKDWPKALALSNTEGVAFSLIDAHPGAIEIAGVILLMSMLGAVILSRKKVEMDEEALREAVLRERSAERSDELGIEGPYATPGVGQGGAA
jgi:NADH-quinone oxidoreductase subunit J